MFYPRAMTEIELIVPARDLLAVTKVLSNEGVFQQADNSYLGLDNETRVNKKDTTWQERAAAYATLERRIQAIMQALCNDEGYPSTAEFESMAEIEKVRPEVERIEREVKGVSDQLAEEQKRQDQMQTTLTQLEPVADIDLDISLMRHPRYLFSLLGTMPTENIGRMQTSLNRVPHMFLILRQDPQKAVVWLAGSQKNADILGRAGRSAYLNPVALPEDYQGTPAQIISELRSNIAQSRQQAETLQSKIAQLCKTYGENLQTLLWNVRSSRMMADAIVRFGRLQYTYLIVGWVFSNHMEDLGQRIKQVSKETLIEASPISRGEHHPNVPVALHNPRFMRPFQSLVTTYARPAYNELDPTFLIAITFPLLFGAMFGDVGQGLVLAVLGWLMANKKIKALNSMSGLGGLIMACGGAATVFGFLYGSIFGFEDVLHPLWLSPLHHIMDILLIAIGAGVVLLVAGFLIGIFNAYVSKDWGHLFFDRNGIAGFVLYLSVLMIVAGTMAKIVILPTPVLLVFIAISSVAIMFSEVLKRLVEGHRPLITEGVGTYAIQAVFELFETLISFLSNTLSYVRVGAFAVAHAGLSQVIFLLAGTPGTVGYIIALILGNIFIIGFEGLIVGIQTMRLEYYEFFSKFFKGGGSSYEPLTLRPTEND